MYSKHVVEIALSEDLRQGRRIPNNEEWREKEGVLVFKQAVDKQSMYY